MIKAVLADSGKQGKKYTVRASSLKPSPVKQPSHNYGHTTP